MSQDKNNISRRKFLKLAGLGAVAASVPVACLRQSASEDPVSESQPGTMTYRTNPSTGDKVSILGFGCMRLPNIKKSSAPDADTEIDQEAVNRQVDLALKHGVNYFDTSPAYCKGKSEHVMGIALSRHPRDSYYIATKLSNFSPETWPREKSIAMFENSLKELQTDYVDYMLLHAIGGGGMQAYNSRYEDNGILDYLIEQKEAGRIRNLGFSYHGDITVFDHLLSEMDRGRVHWDFVQIQMNYIDWRHAKEVNERETNAEYLYSELQKRGIPAVIMEPLLGGSLANVPTVMLHKMKSRRPNDSPAKWAFRYAGTPEGVLTVLSGMTYIEHLEENIATYSPLEPITDEENKFLDLLALDYLANDLVPCTDCKYCMPCPYGVDIPGTFSHYNKCLNEEHITRDTRDPQYAESRRAYLVGYDRAVPRLRQAAHCIGCGNCVTHCPQSIDIPTRLREIDDYTERLRAGKA